VASFPSYDCPVYEYWVAKGGIEPPTQGFSGRILIPPILLHQYLSSAQSFPQRKLLCVLHP
jgi:hypothetical protein